MIAKTGKVRVILGISVYLLGLTGCGVLGNQHSEKPAVKQTAPPSRAQGPQNYSSLTAEQWVNLSVAYYQDAKYLEAIAAAQTAVYLKPGYAEAYNNMGAAYGALHVWPAAIQADEQALRLKPNFPLAQNNLAWAMEQKRIGAR